MDYESEDKLSEPEPKIDLERKAPVPINKPKGEEPLLASEGDISVDKHEEDTPIDKDLSLIEKRKAAQANNSSQT